PRRPRAGDAFWRRWRRLGRPPSRAIPSPFPRLGGNGARKSLPRFAKKKLPFSRKQEKGLDAPPFRGSSPASGAAKRESSPSTAGQDGTGEHQRRSEAPSIRHAASGPAAVAASDDGLDVGIELVAFTIRVTRSRIPSGIATADVGLIASIRGSLRVTRAGVARLGGIGTGILDGASIGVVDATVGRIR